jgi:hypothetical protein
MRLEEGDIMSKRDPHDQDEPKRGRGEGRHREEPHGTGYGTERSVYEEFLARKWQGSAPPSPQTYARAIRLWRQLPGSIIAAPADFGTIPESTGYDAEPQPSRQADANDERNRS